MEWRQSGPGFKYIHRIDVLQLLRCSIFCQQKSDHATKGIPVVITHRYFLGDHQEVYFTIPASLGSEFKFFTHREKQFSQGATIYISLREDHLTFCHQ